MAESEPDLETDLTGADTGGQPEPTPQPDEPTEPAEPQPAPEGATDGGEGAGEGEQEDAQDLRAFYKKHFGIDLSSKYDSDIEAAKGLANAYRLVGERNEDAEMGKRLRTDPYGVYQQLAQQYANGTVPTEQPKPKEGPDGERVYDPEWLQYVEVKEDADGNTRLVPVPGAPPGIVEKINRGRQTLESTIVALVNNPLMRQLVQDPAKAIDVLAEKLVPKIQEWSATTQQEQQEQQAIGQFLSRHSAWVFQNPDDENPKLSEKGHRLVEMAEAAAKRKGLPWSLALEDAYRDMELEHLRNLTKKTPPTPPVPAKAKGTPRGNLAPPSSPEELPVGEDLEADLIKAMKLQETA